MPWFKVDDSFHSHPKVLATSPAALGLWVVAGAWSSANLTEGFVPDRALPRLIPDSEPLARELVSVGLWRRERGGYRFHDWIAYNPTRSEAIAARDRMASGGALGNHRRWHVDKGKTDPDCRYCQEKQDRGTDRVPDRVGDGVPESPPSPPVPSRPVPRGTGGGVAHGGTPGAPEPPRQCPDHIGDPDPPRCGGCADARRRHQQWADQQRQADQQRRSATARAQAAARRAAIDRCGMCDDRGYLTGTSRVCTHDPNRTSNSGAAAARAALAARARARARK